jgi:HD-GYP domain-containing protein (c-di-GMP phosphodiesterase class II)
MSIDGQGPISVDDLVEGMICPCDFVDGSGLLLIAAQVEITASLIENLRTRGVKALHPRRSGNGVRTRPKRRVESRRPPIDVDAISTSYDAAKVQRIKKQFLAGEHALVQLTESFNRNRATDLRDTEPHVENYINELADDPDPVVANALKYEADLELARRCVQFSILSLAIARQMEVSEEEMLAIGSAALVHDWALFNLPPECRFPHQIDDEAARLNYLRHPIDTEEMLKRVDGVSAWVMLFATQVHELLDGTGFPNGLKANSLPAGSRILSIADAYLTMTCPPAGSVRIVPCDAIAYLISAASQSRYSAAAVTGLLKVVTLYPIGSIVELSDTTQARVIRSNGNDYGYPIVETLSRPFRQINLKEADLFVTRPVTSTRRNEVRLPETYTELSQALSQA